MMVTPVMMVMVMVPRTIAADAARAVIGPDGAAEAARPVIIVGIVGRFITIKARTEMVVMMMPVHHRCGNVRAAMMIEAAAANGVHAAAVKGWAEAVNSRASEVDAAANASEMSATPADVAAATSEMTAASTAVAASTPATMSAATATTTVAAVDFGDQRVSGVFRDRRRSRIDRRKGFCALHRGHHQHRSGCDAQRLRQTVPEIWNGHHG